MALSGTFTGHFWCRHDAARPLVSTLTMAIEGTRFHTSRKRYEDVAFALCRVPAVRFFPHVTSWTVSPVKSG
jgi:hypothetical protein